MSKCGNCCYGAMTGPYRMFCSVQNCLCEEVFYCEDYEPIVKPKTNADLLRAMSDEELVNFILHHDVCPGFVTDTFSDENRKKYGFDGQSERCEWKDECHECWLDWLREEVE